MGLYHDQVLPRLVDIALSGPAFTRLRAEVTAGLEGEVVEVGFGSGRNVPHYPAAVKRVRAVDPAVAGRRLAAARLAASPVPVEYLGLDGEHLPLEDASIDHVLSTWTMCTIPDVERALREIHRVLRPGGAFHFVEHGLAPDRRVARCQDLLDPLQRRIAGGCHLNRPIEQLIEGSGMQMERLDRYFMSGPKPYTYMYQGVARRPPAGEGGPE